MDAGNDAPADVADDAATPAAFGVPVEIAVLTGATDNDYGPSVGDGDRVITFTTSRNGGFTIWTANRTAPTAMFSAPTQIAAVDVAGGIEHDSELSTDALELLFAALGAGAVGGGRVGGGRGAPELPVDDEQATRTSRGIALIGRPTSDVRSPFHALRSAVGSGRKTVRRWS